MINLDADGLDGLIDKKLKSRKDQFKSKASKKPDIAAEHAAETKLRREANLDTIRKLELVKQKLSPIKSNRDSNSEELKSEIHEGIPNLSKEKSPMKVTPSKTSENPASASLGPSTIDEVIDASRENMEEEETQADNGEQEKKKDAEIPEVQKSNNSSNSSQQQNSNKSSNQKSKKNGNKQTVSNISITEFAALFDEKIH